MDQLFQCSIVWISLIQIPHTHENISNFEVTIEMFIFLDSNHSIPNPTKTYKNPKVPKNPPNYTNFRNLCYSHYLRTVFLHITFRY